ncbi:hypothetical protein FDO65_02870 [Nakamurella flava]|uniref:Uncharacterized protein n=1 Tax=Nakamurella flava TaxID=2576308 RepID=A0A4U6QJQ3_9ACTN|nr:hypothetical protein [Nakamurella flava]TKV60654.1 hypothetical protein FDO65_02870 [Nakamurella flava]
MIAMEDVDACARLADLIDEIAAARPSPRQLLDATGERAAGIRSGLAGLLDLKAGGRDLVPGVGFRAEYDDGTRGQVRHFAGIVVSTVRMGGPATRLVSERIRNDPADSPDGRLSLAGIQFAQEVLSGAIPVAGAGQWVRDHLSARPSPAV